jgi:hypothetical protein
MLETTEQIDPEQFIASLQKDYSSLSVRIRELIHSVKCETDGVTLRLYFPAISHGKPKILELVSTILDYVTTFALSRAQADSLMESYGTISADEFRVRCERLQREAIALFIRAQKATNRTGEAGELLLYLLTEWILKAPQILAKMGLKTNRDMPVHGTDGIHIGYSHEKKSFCFYWGESKLFEDVNTAISRAAKSIKTALKPQSMEHEISLVARNINAAGLSQEEQSLVLSFLDPYGSENYNKRVDVITCLIGFNFDAFDKLDQNSDEQQFRLFALAKLQEIAPHFSKALKSAGIRNQPIEVFFFPVPSVQDLRDLFQAKIGWKNDSSSS